MQLLPASLFVSSTLHERTVKLADGSQHVLHFRELPVAEFRRFGLAERSSDPEVQASAMTMLIAASLCNPDGSPALTREQAARLKPDAANAIATAVLDVNNIGAAGKA